MRIMTGGAGDVCPFCIMSNSCVCRKLAVAGGEEIGDSLRLIHASICQSGCGSVAGDTVFRILAVDYVVGRLSAALFTEFCSNICLSDAVFAGRPGIIG